MPSSTFLSFIHSFLDMFNFTDFTTLLASLSLAPAFERPDVLAAGPRDTQTLVQTDPKAACIVESYPSVPITRSAFEPFDAKIADIYRYRKQQSVNLGGWFVLQLYNYLTQY